MQLLLCGAMLVDGDRQSLHLGTQSFLYVHLALHRSHLCPQGLHQLHSLGTGDLRPPVSVLASAPSSDSGSKDRGSSSPWYDGPVHSSTAAQTPFMLWGAPLTVHFSLVHWQHLQHQALPGGGHSQVCAALAQLSQSGLEPSRLLTRFLP